MALNIRLAREDDFPRCREIELAADRLFLDAGHPEFADAEPGDVGSFNTAVAAGLVLVAELATEVVGFALADRCDDELYLVQISVDPDHQRRSIGRSLMERHVDDARRAGEPSIVLNTQSDVAWNRPFYESLGFEVVPPEQWTPGMADHTAHQTEAGFDWSTRVHMRLKLG